MIEHVVGGQASDPGKSTDVDGKPGARHDVLWCCVWETRVGHHSVLLLRLELVSRKLSRGCYDRHSP
jgi:hypothetical protein